MGNLTRKQQKVFAESATNTGQFGSLQAGSPVTSSDPDVIQALAAFDNGWNDATISGEELPTLEETQGIDFLTTRQIAYLMQKGIPEWETSTDYYIGDIAREVGGTKIYKSITDSNIGNALTDVANWKIIDITASDLTVGSKFNVAKGPTTEISSGAITYSGGYMTIDVEGGAASSDDLLTINGGSDGDLLLINVTSSSRNINLVHGTGNLNLPNSLDILLNNLTSKILLVHRDGIWEQVCRSLTNDFRSSKSTNGYIYHPSGVISQWGYVASVGANAAVDVTLPRTYPNAHANCGATLARISDITDAAHANTTSLSQIRVVNGATSTQAIFWTSIGY